MKALYTKQPGDYALVERPMPTLAAGEALIKVGRAALHTVNVEQQVVSETLEQILGGRGADVVIECAGTRKSEAIKVQFAP